MLSRLDLSIDHGVSPSIVACNTENGLAVDLKSGRLVKGNGNVLSDTPFNLILKKKNPVRLS